jgi:riboflavin synthase
MFTGIVSEIGTVISVRREGGGLAITVEAHATASAIGVDDSVAVDGVCQTVVACTGETFTVQAVEETLRKTTLGLLRPSSHVNLELPVRLQDRLGGHLVQGHVDATGNIAEIRGDLLQRLITIEFPAEFRKYVVPVGSIAVDGISFTVAALQDSRMTLAVIPHTVERTTLGEKKIGAAVNLEFDLVGKYLESLLRHGDKSPGGGLTEEDLRSWGY